MDAKIKEALNKIFKKLNIDHNSKFTDVKLADGTTLSYDGDTPAVGMAVMLDGNPAADGEYSLPDGTMIHVMGGKISEIMAPGDMKAEDKELQELLDWLFTFKKTEAPAMEAKFKKLTEDSNALIDSLKAELKASNDKIKAIEETASQMFKLVEKIAGLPAVESAFKKKDGFPDPKSLKTMSDIKEAADKLRKQFNS